MSTITQTASLSLTLALLLAACGQDLPPGSTSASTPSPTDTAKPAPTPRFASLDGKKATCAAGNADEFDNPFLNYQGTPASYGSPVTDLMTAGAGADQYTFNGTSFEIARVSTAGWWCMKATAKHATLGSYACCNAYVAPPPPLPECTVSGEWKSVNVYSEWSEYLRLSAAGRCDNASYLVSVTDDVLIRTTAYLLNQNGIVTKSLNQTYNTLLLAGGRGTEPTFLTFGNDVVTELDTTLTATATTSFRSAWMSVRGAATPDGFVYGDYNPIGQMRLVTKAGTRNFSLPTGACGYLNSIAVSEDGSTIATLATFYYNNVSRGEVKLWNASDLSSSFATIPIEMAADDVPGNCGAGVFYYYPLQINTAGDKGFLVTWNNRRQDLNGRTKPAYIALDGTVTPIVLTAEAMKADTIVPFGTGYAAAFYDYYSGAANAGRVKIYTSDGSERFAYRSNTMVMQSNRYEFQLAAADSHHLGFAWKDELGKAHVTSVICK